MGEFGASAHCIGERVMHRVSTQAKARLRSFDFRLQCLLNFSHVLKIGTRFVHRCLSFGNWRTIDCLAGGEAEREDFGLDRRNLLQDGLGFDQRFNVGHPDDAVAVRQT
jgi:hypothetical protein